MVERVPDPATVKREIFQPHPVRLPSRPRASMPRPAETPTLEGGPVPPAIPDTRFVAVPRREVQARPNPETGMLEYQIVVVNGRVINVPPSGWIA